MKDEGWFWNLALLIGGGRHLERRRRGERSVAFGCIYRCVIFFFKQKTAYEISECDWSSDVCSSDLIFCYKQKTAYEISECDWSSDRKSTRLNSSHIQKSRMPSSACDWSSDVCSSDQIG